METMHNNSHLVEVLPDGTMLAIVLILALPTVLFTYLIGSVPFGLLLAKLFTKTDITKIGSGNIGATNVLRTGHKFAAALTLFCDILKGALCVLIGQIAQLALTNGGSSGLLLFIGLIGILGHCFPVWLKFKGGKGVATTFGVLFAAVPWAGFIAAVTWGIVAGFSRISSLAALSAMAIVPLVTLIYYGAIPAVMTVLIAALVFWRHKDNIKRLMAGTESKIGGGKSEKKDKDEPAA